VPKWRRRLLPLKPTAKPVSKHKPSAPFVAALPRKIRVTFAPATIALPYPITNITTPWSALTLMPRVLNSNSFLNNLTRTVIRASWHKKPTGNVAATMDFTAIWVLGSETLRHKRTFTWVSRSSAFLSSLGAAYIIVDFFGEIEKLSIGN
jgi:hypothetical protein